MSSALTIAEERDTLQEQNRRLALERDELSAKNGELVTRNDELDAKLRELNKKLELYEEQVAWFKNKLYGRGTEQLTDAELQQIRLFDEIEQAADSESPEDQAPSDEPPSDQAAAEVLAGTGSRPRHKPLPQALPRVERLVDLPEQDKQCECGHALVRIGEDTSEKLDVIPPQVRVIRTVRPKYACHHCEGSGDEEHPAVRIAPPPAALIPKGLASEGLLAFIATAKFCDALPLYRQERQFARLGVELSRRTMSDWMIAAATACQALMQALLDKLRSGPILAIDETTVQVLKEQDRANTDTSYVWVARGGPPDEPVVVYRYEPSRAARVAFEIIGDYQATCRPTGTTATRARVRSRHRARGLLGARAARVQGGRRRAEQASSRAGAALQALGFIAKLYRAESELSKYRDEDPERFVAARRARVQPVLDTFHGWLQEKRDRVLPSTALGKAVAFALGEWPKLIRYLDHQQLRPDNKRLRAGDPAVVVGRKNWLVFGEARAEPRRARSCTA